MPLLAPDKNRIVHRTFKYRIYPTKAQIARLENQLAFNCALYNAALEQRRDAWKRGRRSISLYDQMSELTDLRAELVYPEKMACHVQRDPLRRLDRAFEDFFRRCKRGEKPGYPRFRSQSRYDSLTWPLYKGAGLRAGRLRLAGIGAIRVRWHRDIPEDSEIKTITVKRKAGRWYVCFSLELPLPESPAGNYEAIGVDLGITTFACLSNGATISGPRAYRVAQRRLRVAQRRVSRRKRGSNRRKKASAILARKHENVRNVRRDHAHKAACDLVQRYGVIAMESLNTKGLSRGWNRKDVLDQGWAQFITILRDKAEWAGREVVLVNPRGTSQECSVCGTIVRRPLSQRVHRCECGYVADRDLNAARNILNRGLGRSLQALTEER